jgi:hypothetical protein
MSINQSMSPLKLNEELIRLTRTAEDLVTFATNNQVPVIL